MKPRARRPAERDAYEVHRANEASRLTVPDRTRRQPSSDSRWTVVESAAMANGTSAFVVGLGLAPGREEAAAQLLGSLASFALRGIGASPATR